MTNLWKKKSSNKQDDERQKVPRHIVMIMDGNGRWAKRRALPRFAGHKAGLEVVQKVVTACSERGVEALTLFAFSSENWRRPEKEVSLLMELFLTALRNELKKLTRNNVRLRVIGGTEAFSQKIQQSIKDAEQLTESNSGIVLNIAANYGGRWDILNAVKSLMQKVQTGELKPEDLNESILEQQISMSDLPEPDLFIRTGGEKRISNFLLWQLAYTELYFTDTLWPDFNDAELNKAIAFFCSRQRRFGRTGEQVEQQVSGA